MKPPQLPLKQAMYRVCNPPVHKPWMAIWKGSTNPILRGRKLTMVINQLQVLGSSSKYGPISSRKSFRSWFLGASHTLTNILTGYLENSCGWSCQAAWKTQESDGKPVFVSFAGAQWSQVFACSFFTFDLLCIRRLLSSSSSFSPRSFVAWLLRY